MIYKPQKNLTTLFHIEKESKLSSVTSLLFVTPDSRHPSFPLYLYCIHVQLECMFQTWAITQEIIFKNLEDLDPKCI